MLSILNILFIGDTLRKKCNDTITAFILQELQTKHRILYWNDLSLKRNHPHVDLILLQNSCNFIRYQSLLKMFSKIPVVFISDARDISGYIAPFDNLFAVITSTDTYSTTWGIPFELQIHLHPPFVKKRNFYRYDEKPPFYSVVYFPTRNTVQEADGKLFALAMKYRFLLNIVSDEYAALTAAFNSNIKIIKPEKAMSVLKKAHVVVASCQNVINSLALTKPCVVLGDYGLGGMITTDNYKQLRYYGFRGRPGGTFKEFIPIDVLEVEIKKAISNNCKTVSQELQKKIIADYGVEYFHVQLYQTIESVVQLSYDLKKTVTMKKLKPRMSSVFRIFKDKGKVVLMRGHTFIGEIDQETEKLLKQCIGIHTIEEILLNNGYRKSDITVFAYNIRELWKEKMIVFS